MASTLNKLRARRYAQRPMPFKSIVAGSDLGDFYKDDNGEIFHTYSSYGRGGEDYLGTYRLLDIVPKGRNETINGNLTDWVRHHDRYEAAAKTEL